LGSPRAKANASLFRMFRFVVEFGKNKFSFLAAAFFFKLCLSLVFNQQVFKFLVFSFNKFSFVSKVSGWLCQVAETGFKIFSLRFGLRWF
jgi:hypothetical protein